MSLPNSSPKLDLLISPFDANAKAVIALGVHAEQAGFDGVWTYDHMTGAMFDRGASLEPFTILGALAASTEKVQLGPLVANVRNRHPVQLALAARTLQDLSNDRAVIGLGGGAAPGSRFAREHESLGTELGDGPERRERLIEAIGLVRSMWAGNEKFDGRFYAIENFDFNLANDAPPPIIVGASGPATAELALSHADGLNVVSAAVLDRLADQIVEDRSDTFEISVHVMLSAESGAPAIEQLPDPSPLVDRWIFAIPGTTQMSWVEDLREAIDLRCLLYTSPSPRDQRGSRMPSSA